MRRRPFAALSLLGLALHAQGCSDKDEPARRAQGLAPGEEVPKGPLPATAPPQKPQRPPSPPRSSLPSPFLKGAPNPGALTRDAGPEATAEGPAAVDAAAAADAGPARDLATELLALMGHPARCVDFAVLAREGGRLNITMSVYVTPSGRITRTAATAPGQPDTVLRCLERGVANARFRGPVEGAPREVTATLPIEVVAQPAAR